MSPNQLGSILKRMGKVDVEHLETALAWHREHSCSLGDALIELKYVSAEDVAKALSVQLNIPFFELGEDFRLEQHEIKLIPEAVARRLCVIPLKKNHEPSLTVVMKDPLDIEAVDTVRSLTNMEIHKGISTGERIMAVIDRFYREDAHIEQNLQDIVKLESADIEVEGAATEIDAEQLRVLANDAPVVRFVNLLLMQAARDRASDVHFEPGEKEVAVRLRVDGVLREVTPPPKSLYQAIVTRIKILSNMDIAERRLPMDGRMKFKVRDRVIDVRVSSLPEVHGEKLVLRLLDRATVMLDMHDIGFEDALRERFQRILELPHGIILLTGPTGSGKTTTLYGALNYLKSPEVNIQTVEDPVEYLMDGINQMQMKSKIGLDFATSLRSILRQDPDVILVGEIRDVETARIAMRASLTGHLVLSTLHTNDAPSAFSRLKDIGIEPYLIASTVNLVIAQRLVRVICPSCKERYDLPKEQMAIVKSICPDAESWEYFHGVGCRKCANTGYMGRSAIFEFLEVADSIRGLIAGDTNERDIRQKAMETGMDPLEVSGLSKVKRGFTTVDEVLSVCSLSGIKQ